MLDNWFQTDECFDFYSCLSFLEPFKFEVRRGDEIKGRIVGYIQKDGGKLKQFFSRRAIVNGGPMLADDITEEELYKLFETCIKKLKHKVIYIETRNFSDYSKFKEIFRKNGFLYKPHYDIKINCSKWEKVEDCIGKHRKKYIRLSFRDGASIVSSPSIDQVKEFYSILVDLYRTKVKTPIWPFEFFEKMYYSGFGKFILVEYKKHIIGGSACVIDYKNSVYEWFACGNDGQFKNIHPSSLVKYGGMKYAYDCKCQYFDMMGAGAPNDGGYGVRDFKMEFGGQLVEYGRFRCILNKPLYHIGKLGVILMKKIK